MLTCHLMNPGYRINSAMSRLTHLRRWSIRVYIQYRFGDIPCYALGEESYGVLLVSGSFPQRKPAAIQVMSPLDGYNFFLIVSDPAGFTQDEGFPAVFGGTEECVEVLDQWRDPNLFHSGT